MAKRQATGGKSQADYSRYLVCYSGGADSTFFIQREPTAKHLIHYAGRNTDQTRTAVVNANTLGRFLTVVDRSEGSDGETNQIHALYDTEMALNAAITALRFGMRGIVLCFNKDDIGIDIESLAKIVTRVDSSFEILTPLRQMTARQIRDGLDRDKLRFVSCMYSVNCGFCAKCRKGY